jgi:hypothetical protein
MKKSKIFVVLIAALVFSMFAVLPMHRACAEGEEDPFTYTYPLMPKPGNDVFAWIGELAPGESTPWVAVTIGITGPATYPVYQTGGWVAEVTKNDGSKGYWIVTAVPGPTYTWNSATSTVEVDIKVTVPADWTEECYHTFQVKLLPGYDSKTNSQGKPTPQTIGSGEGVHFKVCVKIPPQEVLSIECESFMTDSSFNRIESFDAVWTPRDPKGRDYYKLASTNPGQFMYNIWIHNNGNVNVESLTVTYAIDDDFVLKGADPIQVWTGYGKTGTRMYEVAIDYGTRTITITYTLEPGAELWITFHLEYKWVRQQFTAAQMLTWKADHEPNNFSCVATAYATGFDPYVCGSPEQDTTLPDPLIVLGVED